MKKIKPDILGGTFSHLHIPNKSSDISSLVEEMDLEENYNIKLITSSPREDLLRMRHLRKRMKEMAKTITVINPISPIKKPFPLIQKKNKSKKNFKSILLKENKTIENKKESPFSKKKLLFNKGKLKININECLLEKKDRNNIINSDNEEIKKFDIISERKQNDKKFLINSMDKHLNLYKTLKHDQMKTINNLKLTQKNKFITESIEKEKKTNKERFYQTAKLFSEQKLFSNRKLNNIKRKSLLSKTQSQNIVKPIPRLKISEAYLSDIENKLNSVYESNKVDLVENDKIIKEFKKKYQNLFDNNEKLYSYDIARITKEINDQLLSLKFKDFYSYLLTILKNYDKHIVDWKFTIEKDKKECPPELRLKNVKIRHKKFMGKLNRQYDTGLKVNKLMDDLLLNAKKKEMIFNKIKNKNNMQDYIIKKYVQDDFVDKIFENNQIYQNNLNNNDIQ